MSIPSTRSLAGLLLIVVAVGAVAVGLGRQARRDAGAAPAAAADAPGAVPRDDALVTVYYFHGETRCSTCRAIEAQTERVLRERFGAELASRRLRFESVDFDAPAGRHFQRDYDLAFGSVVVQGSGDGRPWENLADVWTLIHDEPSEFEAYVVEHVRRMLEPAG